MPQQIGKDAQPSSVEKARYFDKLQQALGFNADELRLLEQNRFVVSERLTFEQFMRAYAWIYWKDLPVLVTTDSLLHAIHQTYDQMFQQVEYFILKPGLMHLLTDVHACIEANTRDNTPPDLSEARTPAERLAYITEELVWYLEVPLNLLLPKKMPEMRDKAVAYVDKLSALYDRMKGPASTTLSGIETIVLFDRPCKVDLSLFRPRGHYDEYYRLGGYFCAVTWLALLDFRFIEFDQCGVAALHRDQLAAAYILLQAVNDTGHRQALDGIDRLFQAFIGWSDNVNLTSVERFFEDVGISDALDCYRIDEAVLVKALLEKDYGHQRIRGQHQQVIDDAETSLPHNVSFSLMGQRFTIESYIMQHLIYDKLIVNGIRVERPNPSPLDVMYVLGNDRALEHLDEELARYGYQENLNELHEQVRTYSHEFWENSFYNLWLSAIRTLGQEPDGKHYPQVMKSQAWKDKMLNTQLGSWAQLRRDNILYVKPPHLIEAVCEYPAGYVEPCPAFYEALQEYARFGKAQFEDFVLPVPSKAAQDICEGFGNMWGSALSRFPQPAIETLSILVSYFTRLSDVAGKLAELARKELAGQPFNEEDNLFLRSVVVRKYVGPTEYGGWSEEHWDGWYRDLLPYGDQAPMVTADIATNYNVDWGNAGVLHIGTGKPVVTALLVENDGQETVYVGPSFTYYEHLEEYPPYRRLTDKEWKELMTQTDSHVIYLQGRLEKESDPEEIARLKTYLAKRKAEYEKSVRCRVPPAWTASFMVPSREQHENRLPTAFDLLDLDVPTQDLLQELGIGTIGQIVRMLDAPSQQEKFETLGEARVEALRKMLDEKGFLGEDRHRWF